MSDKVTPRHLERKALLYVRQSSPQQLQNNEESRRLQYAMETRLRDLGWTEIEVIDADLGQSAAGATSRAGFERMVAEVSLGAVGAVSARELSRFARNSREWQRLVEISRLVGTVLVDQDEVYDPRRSNDRLLLGLKGTLNEYELELLRLRADEARQAKAKRGELSLRPPVGYVQAEGGRLEKTPDLRVQEAVHLVFKKVFELGSVRAAMGWLRERQLRVPVTQPSIGAGVEWRAPNYTQLLGMVKNPSYAGAYAYGKTFTKVTVRDGREHRVSTRRAMSEWTTLIKDHHDGYITWEHFESIQRMISKNAQLMDHASPGAAKLGRALLAGIVRCRRCGRRAVIGYTGSKRTPRYTCFRGNRTHGDPKCFSFSGVDVDQRVSEVIIEALQPAAAEATLRAAAQQTEREQELQSVLRTELKAARYACQRAQRQYDAVDPDNRLVADELERRWNTALGCVQEIEKRIEEQEAERRQRCALPCAEVFSSLAEDLESIWNHPSTDHRLKKRIVRTLIEEVIADVDDATGTIVLLLHWKGGVHTELRVPKLRPGQKRDSSPVDITEVIRMLSLVCSDTDVARWLNMNDVPTARGTRWTRDQVTSFRSQRKICRYSPEVRQASGIMTLTEVTALVRISLKTLYKVLRRKELPVIHPLPKAPWIFRKADVLAWNERRQSSTADDSAEPFPSSRQLHLAISRI
jgi:DNA invertase Pin-like site-specific DNA recombinase/predicted DNA-binding transcriptional regulator AlpA